MVPWLRQHENFLTSNLCIPGLVTIPNRTVMKASKPHCVLFSHWLAWLDWSSLPFQVLKESTLIPLPPPLLSVPSSWGPPCWHQYACTQCARTGLLAAGHFKLYLYHKLPSELYCIWPISMTLACIFAVHMHTELNSEQLQWVNKKKRTASNSKFSYIISQWQH